VYLTEHTGDVISTNDPVVITLATTVCLSVAAPNRSSVPVRLRAADGVLVPPELPYHCSNSGSSADAGAVSAGDAGVHVRTVRLPAGIHGVSTAFMQRVSIILFGGLSDRAS